MAESIGMKMRWLARGLRKCDKQNEIEDWVASMTSLWVLLQKMRSDGAAGQTHRLEKHNEQPPKTNLLVSLPQSKSLDKTQEESRRVGRPPRVEVEEDDIDMVDPKAAVMEMLRKEKKKRDKQETKKLQGELSLIEKKRNREIWRKGMLDRVKKEEVPVEHWGTVKSGNFKIMIGECAPHRVRVAVGKDVGFHKADQWLYEELMKFYDKG